MMAAPAFGAGRFEVRGTLGAGGAGVVYRAYDRQLGREVAIKLLRKASGRDLFRFKREFRALADIVHPNLVALHELHELGGDWYFTMELVEGVSFIDWVRPPRDLAGPARSRQDIVATPPDVHRLRAALAQLADAMVALHEAGKLHRDLKPSNLLITATGRLAVLDFGLVASVAEGNPERVAVGTPVYMSPEQAADQPLTEASDWYSVGAILYEALTGRRPFEGESERVMTRKQTEQPADPSGDGVPPDLAQLSMALLRPSPASRPTGRAVLAQLGAAPSPETREIARNAAAPPFVGRTRELDELRAALRDARRRGGAAMVRGKSGMGKTTLVRHFARELGDAAFVLEGRCFEREQVPFKMLDAIVDALTGAILALPLEPDIKALAPRDVGALVRLFPVLRRIHRFAELGASAPADPAELRRRGFAALRSVLARLSRIRPVVLFVDDAHWGDADSAVFLSELIHQPEPAMLVVLAHRPEDYLGVVAKLKLPPAGATRRGDIHEIEVGSLSEGDARALAAGLVDERRVEQIVRAGAGSPLVITELAQAPRLAPGARIEDVVAERASYLPPDAQAMLAVSAIAARPIPIEIAAHAAGVIASHEVARRLVAERLATLRRIDGQWILQPVHDHVRAAVVASLGVEARAGWHEVLARAFEAVQGQHQLDAEAVVEHWLAAGHPAKAAHHAVAAADRAEEALAFRRAAQLYELAATYGPWKTSGQRDLLRRQGHALVCAGQLDEAAAIYAHAAQLLPDDEALDCERLRIEALLRRGRLDEALPAAEHLLAQIGIRSPLARPRTRLGAQWTTPRLRDLEFVERKAEACRPVDLRRIDVLYSVASGLAFVDPILGRSLQAELLRAAFECGEPTRVCFALAQEVCYAAAAGSRSWPAVEAVGRRLETIARRLGHPHALGLADTAIGIAAYMGGRWHDARDRLEAGLATLRAHGAGVRWEIDIGEQYWLATLYYLGEWRELARQGQLLLRDAVERGDVAAQIGIRTGRCHLAWLFAGRPDEARAQLEAAEQVLPPGFHVLHVLAVQAAVNIELYRGDPAAAARRLEAAWPDIERIGAPRMQQLGIELQLLRARIELGRPELGDRAKTVRAIAEQLIDEDTPWAIGVGQLVRAAALAIRRDLKGAIEALRAAEGPLEATGMVGWLHVARMRRGRLEGGPSGVARAEAARDALRDLGAADPDAVAALLVPWPG